MRDPLFFLNDGGNNGARLQEQEQYIPTTELYNTPQCDFEQDRTTYSTTPPPQHNKSGQQRTTATMGGVKPAITAVKKAHSTQHRRDREHLLLNTPAETLVQTLIAQEHDAKESRKLLRNALARLDSMRDRTDIAEEARRALEAAQLARGIKVTQSVIDAQDEIARAKSDAQVYRLQLEWTQRELREKLDAVKSVEEQRHHADKAAQEARAVARQLHDERLVAKAREEGRKLGFIEGMHQGKALALRPRHIADHRYHTPLGSGQAYIEEYEEDDDIHHPPNSRRGHVSHEGTPRGPSAPMPPSQPATAPSTPAEDAARLELQAAKQREEEMTRREAERRERIRQLELRESERQRELEADRLAARAREMQLEREKEEMQARDEARQREVQEVLERQREHERELERQIHEERRAREEKEQELQREREKVLSLERQRAIASTTSSASKTSNRLPFLPMPAPPPKGSTPATRYDTFTFTPEEIAMSSHTPPLPIPPPRQSQQAPSLRGEPPQQIQPSPFPPGTHQPSSPDTLHSDGSVTTGVSNLDILTFPTPIRRGVGDWERSNLSDIPEAPSVRSHSRSSMNEEPSPSPSRVLADQWRRSTNGSNLTSPATPVRDVLSPAPRGRPKERSNGDHSLSRASSGSTIPIYVEPPSRPPSSAGIRDPEQRGFLSPNSRPLSIVPEEPTNPPVIPEPVSFTPQGFVPFGISSTISSESSGRGHGRQGSRTGSNIYTNFTPPAQLNPNLVAQGSTRQQPSTRTRSSIYSNTVPPQGPYTNGSITSLTPREMPRQIYAAPSPSGAGPQPLPKDSSQTHQIYAAPSPSGAGSQPLPTDLSRTRQIYAASPSVAGPQPLPSQPRQIYAPSPSISGAQPLPADAERTSVGQRRVSAPRTQIYGPAVASSAGSQTPAQGSRQLYGLPVNSSAGSQTPALGTRQLYALTSSSQGTQSDTSRIYANTNESQSIYGPPPPSGEGTSRSGPAIPPLPAHPFFVPPMPSPSQPTIPLGPSLRSGPVIPGVTVHSPSQLPPPVPVEPFIPPMSGSMTPSGSNIQLNVTPRARFAEIEEDPNEDDDIVHDEETIRNTHLNKMYGGTPLPVAHQPPLPVPPPSSPLPTPAPSMPFPTPAPSMPTPTPAPRRKGKGRR